MWLQNKTRTAKQIIAPYKNQRADKIPQTVIDKYVEAMTREGKTLQTRSSNWQRLKSKLLK